MSENQLIASLTDDYIDSLEKAVKWRSEVEGERITAVEIGKRAGINEATVRRALNGDKNSKTETLVLICLALHLFCVTPTINGMILHSSTSTQRQWKR